MTFKELAEIIPPEAEVTVNGCPLDECQLEIIKDYINARDWRRNIVDRWCKKIIFNIISKRD